jgi:iron complex transport system permease protein
MSLLTPRRFVLTQVFSVLVTVVVVLTCVAVGPSGVSWPEADLLFLRVGRVGVAFLVGAALSITGAALQALLRNSLADPYVLGVSGGAALGAAAVTALGAWAASAGAPVFAGNDSAAFALDGSALRVTAGGVAGASLSSAVLLAFARQTNRGGERIVLVGVVLNAFSWAFVAVVRATLPPSATQALSVWLIGAIGYPEDGTLMLAACTTFAGVSLLLRHSGALRMLRAGEDEARRLGVHVERVSVIVLVACTLLVGVAVATTGVIGFLGLLVPHALRRLVSVDERALLPASALLGGALLCAMDAVARAAFVVLGSEPPVGALCALLGAPGFAWLLWREGRQ